MESNSPIRFLTNSPPSSRNSPVSFGDEENSFDAVSKQYAYPSEDLLMSSTRVVSPTSMIMMMDQPLPPQQQQPPPPSMDQKISAKRGYPIYQVKESMIQRLKRKTAMVQNMRDTLIECRQNLETTHQQLENLTNEVGSNLFEIDRFLKDYVFSESSDMESEEEEEEEE